MKKGMKALFILSLAAMITTLFALPAVAQDKPADNMEILLEKIKADKKLLIAANIPLVP